MLGHNVNGLNAFNIPTLFLCGSYINKWQLILIYNRHFTKYHLAENIIARNVMFKQMLDKVINNFTLILITFFFYSYIFSVT